MVEPTRIDVIGTRGFPHVEGGVEKHCEALDTRMSSFLDVTVYRRKPYVEKTDSYKRVRFIDLPSSRIKGVETVLHSFISTVCAVARKPDIVCYHNIGPALFSPILRLRKIPMVLTYHSPNYEHGKWGCFAKRLLRISERVALKNASSIIFVNRFHMERFTTDVQVKSVYIPNGVNDPCALKSDCYPENFRSLGINENPYILAVGRLTPEKGFDVLIDAFKLAQLDAVQLVIVGGSENDDSCQTELKSRSEGADVIFTGQLHGQQLGDLYANASLYVLASRNEGFPLVLLEAMSYGLDILASDIPGAHLTPLEDDDFFQVGDVDMLKEKLVSKINAPRLRSYNLVSFDWDDVAIKTLDVYKKAIAHPMRWRNK